MGFRYRGSVRLSKRTRVNLGTRRASVSVGSSPLTVNLSRRGARATVGIPGTGVSYVTKSYGGSRSRGSLGDELLTLVFIVILLGTLKAMWSLLVAIGSALTGGDRQPPAISAGDHRGP